MHVGNGVSSRVSVRRLDRVRGVEAWRNGASDESGKSYEKQPNANGGGAFFFNTPPVLIYFDQIRQDRGGLGFVDDDGVFSSCTCEKWGGVHE